MNPLRALRHLVATAAIKPLHREQDGSPYPHSVHTHEALRDHHERMAADHPAASAAHRTAAQMHDHAADALYNRAPSARMLSSKAHSFSRAQNLD